MKRETDIEKARYRLERWAEWRLSGGEVQSRIGYPQRTAESRAGEGGSPNQSGSVVPTWFRGTEEKEIESIIAALQKPTRLAICLHYLWTSYEEKGTSKRVTRVMRENRWSEETNMDPRSYTNHLKRGERAIAEGVS
jgi:hypothetical protein